MHYYIAEAEEEEIDDILPSDCCMKQQIQKMIRPLTSHTLTETELKCIAIWELLLSITFCFCIIQFELVASFLENVMKDTQQQIMVALFLNTLIFVQMVDTIKEVWQALVCECDYRRHPELTDES